MTTKIDAIDTEIEKFRKEWKQNREVVDGARSVTAEDNVADYLPRVTGQDEADFAAYVRRVPFYPAANITYGGLMGMIHRAAATIKHPANVKDILDTITAKGFNVEDLAQEVTSELLITNYCALVVDYPVAPAGLSLAKAIDEGYRPFVALYRAESILGVPETAVINNRQRVTRVRLLDNANTIRELRLDNGVYSIILHRKVGSQWIPDAPIIPTRKGETLDEIPFTLVSTSRDFAPTTPALSNICRLNIDHYIASADYATMRYYSTIRLVVTYNVDVNTPIHLFPGATMRIAKKKGEADVDLLGSSDNSIAELLDAKNDVEKLMVIAGSRILAGDKNVQESGDALRIRDNSQNASIANIARFRDGKLNDALAWVSWWLDLAEDAITYEGNTNFAAASFTPQDIDARLKMVAAGTISLETFAELMIEGDVLPSTYDFRIDQQKIAEEAPDRPTTETSKDNDDEDDDDLE